MINTGIPYDLSLLDDIRKNGAVVDMSNVEFDINTTFIFLRNTDTANVVQLDFSNCDYETKKNYVKDYITTNIRVENNLFVSTWFCVLFNSLGIIIDEPNIFTQEETQKFVDEELEFVGKVLRFLISLPVYALKRFKLGEFEGEEIKILLDDIENIDEQLVGVNIQQLIQHDFMESIYEYDVSLEPANYTKYFTDTNNDLFNAVQTLSFMPLLMGLASESNEKWKEMGNKMKELIVETK